MKAKDEDFGSTPDLAKWISGANDIRQQQAVKFDTGVKNIFETVKPTNAMFMDEFNNAKDDLIQDIGVDGPSIWVTLMRGELVFKFVDPRVVISPHENGKVIDYHAYNLEKLKEVTSYIPNNKVLHSCILVMCCENKNFEFLVEPMKATTLAFEMTYQPFGNEP
jgi:hypothetical protein